MTSDVEELALPEEHVVRHDTGACGSTWGPVELSSGLNARTDVVETVTANDRAAAEQLPFRRGTSLAGVYGIDATAAGLGLELPATDPVRCGPGAESDDDDDESRTSRSSSASSATHDVLLPDDTPCPDRGKVA
jgi:hypothetical protein